MKRSFLVAVLTLVGGPAAADEGLELFERHIRPALVQHCYECHSGPKFKGGLRLDSRTGWQRGGDSGPAIEPGKPDASLLIQAVRYGGDFDMPPNGKLPGQVIAQFERWVKLGAPDPRTDEPSARPADKPAGDSVAARQHWAYQPVRAVAPPAVRGGDWTTNAVDRFLLARIEAAGTEPATPADRATLIRRLTFDLHGLPPTPEAIDAFVADNAPDAYEQLVDRLLASPRFGERWGRHWLDVARFAESLTLRGFILKEAWRYRDYLVDASDRDRPFDQVIREQIAGDLLPAESPADRERQLVATTFLALGNTNLEEQDKKLLEMDIVDEQLDVIGKGLLAQTITCARCHDHKFDPISSRDYYGLAGILKNVRTVEHSNVSKWLEVPLPVDAEQEERLKEHAGAVAGLQARIKAAKAAAPATVARPTTAPDRPKVVAANELPGIVVDDSQAKRVGDWKASQYSPAYIGDGYLHDQNGDKGEKTLTFVPELPADGLYEIRLAYNAGGGRAMNVPVTVFSADGEKTIDVDQSVPPPIDGRFVSLGQFRCERNGQSFVIVSNEGTKGHVIADAVQFLPAELAKAPRAATAAASPAAADASTASDEVKRLEEELKQLQARAPARPMALSVLEEKTIRDLRIHIRGSVRNLGDTVPRGFLAVATTGETGASAMPANASGRRELADWLVEADQPLTARVLTNRIWHWVFGTGLVRTTDNFGTTGELPSHPELLDALTARFVAEGWSVKSLVRELVLSSAYRQSAGTDAMRAADPENRLFGRMPRRRLDAESIRDAMLAASGALRFERGGPGFKSDLAADYGFKSVEPRRSVYVPVFRNSLPELFENFDFADPSVVTGRRHVSTVAPQALFLMNHPFVMEEAERLARRLLAEEPADARARIDRAYRLTLGRSPTTAERTVAARFVGESAELSAWAGFCQALFASIDFRYQ